MVVVDQSVERALERTGRFYVMDNGAIVLEGSSTAASINQINPILLGTTAPWAPNYRPRRAGCRSRLISKRAFKRGRRHERDR